MLHLSALAALYEPVVFLSPQFLCVLCVLLLLQAIALTTALIFEKKVKLFFVAYPAHSCIFVMTSSSHSHVTSSLQFLIGIIFVIAHNTDFFSSVLLPFQTSALFQSSIREGIKHYYDDLDFKNILDYVQQKVVSCFLEDMDKLDVIMDVLKQFFFIFEDNKGHELYAGIGNIMILN